MAEKQAKLAQTALGNPEHRFTNLYSLLHWEYWILEAANKVLARPGSSTAGVDGQTRGNFEQNFNAQIQSIVAQLKAKTYEPLPVRRTYIPKSDGRQRPLGIPGLRDRIVQEALRAILDPIYEADFQHHSYGFRKGRCTMDAIAVLMPLFTTTTKFYWVIEGDITSYFDNVHHRKLMSILRRRIADEALLDLIWKFLKAGVMEGQLFAKTERGVPQGGIVSPLLANVYLNEFDKWAESRWHTLSLYERQMRRKAGLGNYTMVRYADDFVIVSNGTKAEVEQTKEEVRRFLAQELHLELSAEKTVLTHVNDGFHFLGFHIQRVRPEGRWVVHLRPTERNKQRVKDRLKKLTSSSWTWMDEYTRLTSLNRIVKGWCMYYRYTSLVKDLDEITRYMWFRYLQWLRHKYKGSRKHQLIQSRTAVIHNRTRWTASIEEDGERVTAYQWLPTPKEIRRQRYRMKGRGGFPHPYLDEALREEDLPQWEAGPAEGIYTDTIGIPQSGETQDWAEKRLRRKVHDRFTCQRCGSHDNLDVHHIKAGPAQSGDDLITLCRSCHLEETRCQRQKT
jgi:group II intron reverse transcriptase/maturase